MNGMLASRIVRSVGAAAAAFIGLLALPHGMAHAASISHIGTNQNVLVICVKYSDVATTRRTSCQDWVTSMQTEINTFYDRATFGRTTFTFTAAPGPDNGWYNLGLATTAYNFFTVAQAAVSLADPGVNFATFNRVAVLTNFTGFGGQGGGPWWWTVSDGIEATEVIGGVTVGRRLMTMSITNEWLADAGFGGTPGYGAGAIDDGNTVTAHEIGHQLGAPTHYADIRWSPGLSRDVISPWGVMGLSPTLTHFVGWEKDERDWTQTSFVRTVGPPAGSNINQLIRLRPLERTPSGAQVQLIRVPLAVSPSFVGYVVELRRQVNGDENIPSTGVLVSYVDERPDNILKIVVLDDPSMAGNMAQSPLDLGETFSDPGYNLSITYESDVGSDDANVRIQYNLPPTALPNPSITPWGAPPWETPDVWIDAERNGWGTYRYTDGSGNPVGNGDDAWVNHANRVMVRVRNSGLGVATNVRAQVFVNSPPGMGDSGANWDYLGTIVVPSLAAGATATDFVSWTPSVGAHTCIKVVILSTPGETSTSDNLAQENVSTFDTSPGSPYEPVSLKVSVNNPFADQEVAVRYHLRDVPAGWGFMIEPREATLPPGGSESVLVTLFPSGVGEKGEEKLDARLQELRRKTTQIGFLGRPKLEAQIPYADTYVPIGGVEVWTHLVDRTRVTCRIGEQAGGRPRPKLDPRLRYLTPTLKMLEEGLVKPNGVRTGDDATREQSTPARLPKGVLLGGQGETSPAVAAARLLLDQTSLIRPEPEPANVSSNEALVVRGETLPAIANATIAVEIRALDGKHHVALVKTGRDGRYATRLKPLGKGEAIVQAHYAGDMVHGTAESEQCRVIVQ